MESGVSPLLRPYLSLFIAVDKQILIPESLKEVIFDMNKNVVEKEEQLSDAAYYFENGILHKTIL